MKKLLLGTVALAALGASAMAADMGVRPVARPVVAYTNWTGCHIGGMVGMESGQNDGYSTNGASTIVGGSFSLQGGVPFIPGIPLSNSYNTNGFLGGGYGGCDYQFGNWVLGAEGDWSMMNNSGQSFPPGGGPGGVFLPVAVGPLSGRILTQAPTFIFQTTEHWLATARGRLGYAVDKWLFFVSGGGAWARIESNQFVVGLPFTTGNLQNDTRTGWTVGGGFDYALTTASLMPGWSVRVEYLYVNIPSYTTFTNGAGPGTTPFALCPTCSAAANLTTGKLTNNIVRVGLTYKFGNYAVPAVYR